MSRCLRRLAALAVAGLVGSAGVIAGAAAQAPAASVGDVGWWTSSPAASAPEGGLAVSAGPGGTVSLGAVRIRLLVDRVDSARLALAEAGGLQASGAQLQVCPTPNAWSAGPKQAMEEAPKAECDRTKAELSRSADGVWSADVAPLLSASDDDGEVSLMVVPAGAGAVPVGFEVQFEAPTIEATGTSDGGSSSLDTSEFTSGGGSEAGGSSGSTSDFGSEVSSFPSSSFSGPSAISAPSMSSDRMTGTFESTPTASDTAAAAAIEAGASADAATFARTAPAAIGGRGSRYGQGLFFVVVSTLVGVAVGLGHARLRPLVAGD